MTDKEKIITNEIDVGKCEYVCNTAFGKIGCKQPLMKYIHCSENPNCYYKQLQRKIAKCEKLKIEKSNYKQSFELVCKERTKFRDRWLESTYDLENLKNENKHLKKCFLTCSNNLKKTKKQYKFYKQALDEIEKYQRRNCETCVFNKTEKCGISCQTFVILDIINKAKDGNK